MEYTFYAVSNSSNITQVMKWDGAKWVDYANCCRVLSTRPYVFVMDNRCYTPIPFEFLKDLEGVGFSREFTEMQPYILIESDYLEII